MRSRSAINLKNGKTTESGHSFKEYAAVIAVIAVASLLGAFVPLAGAKDSSQIIVLGVASLAAACAVIYLLLDLPIVAVARIVFIASFFFKADVNLFKINEVEDPSGFNISLTFVTALILLVYDFGERKEGDGKVFSTTFSFLVIALFIVAANSILYNGGNTLGWFSLWSFSTTSIVALAVASHFSQRKRLQTLIVGIAAGLTFTGCVALSQYTLNFPTTFAFFGTGTEEELLGTQSKLMSRSVAFLRTPTEMGWIVATLMPFVFAPLVCLVKDYSAFRKLILAAAVPFGAIALILSLARGSWISLFAAAGIIIFLGWIRLSSLEKKNYFVYVGGGLILAGILLSPFAGRIYGRLTMDDEGSANIRLPLMQVASKMIEANPLAGVGMNEYRNAMPKYDETETYVTKVFPNPVHNVFAHITGETGLPGGILFGLLFVAAFVECFKTMTSRDRFLFSVALGGVAALAAFIISAMKEPGSLGSTRPPLKTCFLLFGIIFAVSRISAKENKS